MSVRSKWGTDLITSPVPFFDTLANEQQQPKLKMEAEVLKVVAYKTRKCGCRIDPLFGL